MRDHSDFSNLIWQIADLLRGPYRPPQYELVMLPMTVLRRFDYVLAPTKAKVLAGLLAARGRQDGEGDDNAHFSGESAGGVLGMARPAPATFRQHQGKEPSCCCVG